MTDSATTATPAADGDEGGLPDTLYRRIARETTRFPLLEGTQQAEAVVVGGGLAGLSTAMTLAERGRSVVLLEARRLGYGASGRNGGFLGPGYPLELPEIEQALGLEGARELLRLAREAVAWARGLMERHAIDCGPHPEGHIDCAWHDRPEETRASAEKANERYGLTLRYLTRDELAERVSSPRYHGGLLNPEVTQIQPLDYCRGLGRALAGLGVRLYEESPATRLERQGGGWRVTTPRGAVEAEHLVLCGGGYLGGLHQKLGASTLAVSTHIAATRPLGERLATAIRTPLALSDDRRAGAYYRPLADGRLVWGGRLTMPWERGGNTAAAIRQWIEYCYPQLAPVPMEVGWSGYMSFGRSRMVQLGRLPDGAWFANGFGGSGLGSTAVAGRLLGSAIAEGDDEWRRFEPFRPGWTGGPLGPLAARLVYSGYRLADWLDERRRA